MRRLCLILLACLIAAPAALAAAQAAGDGVLELSNVNGTVVVNGTRGTLWGQIDKGRLVVTDPVIGDGQVLVSGWESRKPGVGVAADTMVYSGTDLRFRVTGGRYRLNLKGSGIDLTAVGIGTSQLGGDLIATTTGTYSLDNGRWTAVPYLPALKLVQFGLQPTTVAGGPSSP